MFYTYAHYRADDNILFYIGKGKVDHSRHLSIRNRNLHWKRVVAKHGIKTEILARWENEEDAFDHEKCLIRVFRELGYPLVNIADGGQGPSGWKPSVETKEKLRKANLGKKQTPEAIEKTRQFNLGKKHTPERIEKTRLSNIGRKHTIEARRNMSIAHKGGRRIYQDVAVRCITFDVVFPSITVAYRLTGAQKGNIVKVCRGQRNETIGLKFEYIK